MRKILKFDSDQIKVAIRRNKKLDMVLQDLEAQSEDKEEFDKNILNYVGTSTANG
jgi:hypothetical protein